MIVISCTNKIPNMCMSISKQICSCLAWMLICAATITLAKRFVIIVGINIQSLVWIRQSKSDKYKITRALPACFQLCTIYSLFAHGKSTEKNNRNLISSIFLRCIRSTVSCTEMKNDNQMQIRHEWVRPHQSTMYQCIKYFSRLHWANSHNDTCSCRGYDLSHSVHTANSIRKTVVTSCLVWHIQSADMSLTI